MTIATDVGTGAAETATSVPAFVVVQQEGHRFRFASLDADGVAGWSTLLSGADLPPAVARLEETRPRWVWDTARVYPHLLEAGVRVERAHDLRLARALLRRSAATAAAFADVPDDDWDVDPQADGQDALFQLGPPADAPAAVDEFARQRAAVATCARPGAMRLLLAAESAGALAAAEMRHVGVPWRADEHERILERHLGPRVPAGERPAQLERLLVRVRGALDAPRLNPDSPVELTRALRAAGLHVESTRSS